MVSEGRTEWREMWPVGRGTMPHLDLSSRAERELSEAMRARSRGIYAFFFPSRFFPVLGIDGLADRAVAVFVTICPRTEEIWQVVSQFENYRFLPVTVSEARTVRGAGVRGRVESILRMSPCPCRAREFYRDLIICCQYG